MKHGHSDHDPRTLRWKPRMKNRPRGSHLVPTSATTHMADRALANMCTVNKLLAQGRDVDEPYVAKLADQAWQAGGAASGPRQRSGRRAGASTRGSRRTLWLAAAGALGVVGATMIANAAGVFAARHTIAGHVCLERRPLGTAELHFHLAGAGEASATVTAARDGTFRLEGIPPGEYRVTVHPPSTSSNVPIATNYTKPESTPFQVHVARDITTLQLNAFKAVPQPRKVTWTPGID